MSSLQIRHTLVLFLIMVTLPCFISHFDDKKVRYDRSFIYSYENPNESNGGRSLLSISKSFNVIDYGAKGDGKSDDTQAFVKAWKEACSSIGASSLLAPADRTYLLKPLTFSGPCTSLITLQIYGSILASNDRSDYQKDPTKWLLIEGVDNLIVQGGGSIDGNGNIWWQNSCKINKKLPCKNAPTALTFYNCKNLVVRNMKIQNAQQMHVSFEKCNNVKLSGVTISAPGNSPNTDGIHIANTQDITVSNTNIGTGDDCISIEDGSARVRAMDIRCGPGHGISIGSLGDGNSEAHVSDVVVNGATLSGTTNGLRIKTWQGGSGLASNIKFQNIKLSNVDNPIIIDQNYCDQDQPCKKQGSAVQVKDVVYQNIKGTTSSNQALVFDCSQNYPCQGIIVQDVIIQSASSAKTPQATCNNVDLSSLGIVSPQCSSH